MTLPRPFKDWTTYAGHGGIDYGQPMGTPIKASGAGMIDFCDWYSDRGGYAKFISYDNGTRCGYYHLQSLSGLGVGQRVEYGQTFAFVGTTGHSTGPHLHHEVWQSGRIIPPPEYWQYIDDSAYVGDGSSAGGDVQPFPPGEPVADDDEGDDMALRMMHWTGGSVLTPTDKVSKLRRAQWDSASGLFMEWTEGDGATYANAMASNWGTGPSAGLTFSLANAIYQSCLRVRSQAA